MSYRNLRDYIEVVDIRNTDLSVTKLLGVSVKKIFIDSIANTVGTDFKKYKLVRKHQFTYIPDTSRRGDKIGVAMLEEYDIAIVSQAYTVFKIIDENKLNPEYLMMWFRRPEFDRYARFKSHGSVREIFDWDEMCDVSLPIPSIEKQNEIVKEYNTIINRINLNETLNQKLEETAQALYKHWFVDFEFPNENGNPYKSSGGEMVYCEDVEKEIPIGFKFGCLNEVVKHFISKRGKSKSVMNLQQYSNEFKYPVISAMNVSNGKIVKHDTIPFVNFDEYNDWMNIKLNSDDVILTSEAPLGESYYLAINSEFALSQRLFALRPKKALLSGWYLYLWLKTPYAKKELEERSSGTTVLGIKLSELKKVSILIPNKLIESRFVRQTISIAKLIEKKNTESQKLSELTDLLLAKMTKIETSDRVLNKHSVVKEIMTTAMEN